MGNQAPRNERQDAVKNRTRILATAQDLFARHGVEDVSMNRIAQDAEVGAGTLYRHFSSKSELCFALIQDHITLLAEELSAFVDACEGGPRTTFMAMTLHYLQFKENKIPLFKGMEQTASHTGGPTQSPVYEILREPFVRLFERAAHVAGKTDPVDAIFRADMLLAALIGSSFQYQHTVRGLSLEDFTQKTCMVFYPWNEN